MIQKFIKSNCIIAIMAVIVAMMATATTMIFSQPVMAEETITELTIEKVELGMQSTVKVGNIQQFLKAGSKLRSSVRIVKENEVLKAIAFNNNCTNLFSSNAVIC